MGSIPSSSSATMALKWPSPSLTRGSTVSAASVSDSARSTGFSIPASVETKRVAPASISLRWLTFATLM